MNGLDELLDKVRNRPDSVEFAQVIRFIDNNYNYTPGAFSNGVVKNEAGTNEGSCKIFAFAKMHQLTVAQTLALFGDFYRVDVLQNPDGTDHANIRNFIEFGWDRVSFDSKVLS